MWKKRTKEQIKKDNENYIINQIDFMNWSINNIEKIFGKLNFKMLWKKDASSIENWNNSFWNNDYKSICYIFEITFNNLKYTFLVSIKSGKNFSYEFARDRKQNHSLRKFHVRKQSCDYDTYTCTNLIDALKKTNLKNAFGYIFTENEVKNNPQEKDSSIYYRNKRIILGNIHNLISYLKEVLL